MQHRFNIGDRTIIAYITRKKFPGEQLYSVLSSLLELAEVTPVDASIVRLAVALQAKDFEDAMQYYSAQSIGADYIVTGNIKDLPHRSKIRF